MSAVAAQLAGSRSRPQVRKKVNDDASYFGPPSTSSAGTKRQATDRLEGEPRMKRKRADPTIPVPAFRDSGDVEHRISLVEFHKLTMPTLYRYLTQFELLPPIYPSPLKADDPPPPSSLVNPPRFISRPPSPALSTPANRPRRDPKEPSRRRSSRLLEEEEMPTRMPIRADMDELHSVLASIADKHFREILSINGREEVDTLASFMCAVEKAKGGRAR
ncbi:hypothetical protein CPB85DRAFT_1235455 [Mucidula mucida]|nr:hypothetical protein CPB85DRAFT_1235455 [Mucidula mucida]